MNFDALAAVETFPALPMYALARNLGDVDGAPPGFRNVSEAIGEGSFLDMRRVLTGQEVRRVSLRESPSEGRFAS